MQITIEIPDNLTERMEEEWGNLSHKILTDLALEAYKNQIISTSELGKILNLDRLEIHALLKKSGVYLNYDQTECEKDLATLKTIRYQ